MLEAIVYHDHVDEWGKCLPPALLHYRATQRSTTGFSPTHSRIHNEILLVNDHNLTEISNLN